MRVVYLDSVFTLNAAVDYLILAAVGRLAGMPPRRGRYLAGALLGGGIAVAVFLPGGAFLSAWWGKLLSGAGMAAAAFWGCGHLFRLTLLTFALSCGLAGCVLALAVLTDSVPPMVSGVFCTDADIRILLLAAGAAWLLLTLVFRNSAGHGVRGELLRARLRLTPDTTVELTALRDSGNALRDPVSGLPALVVSARALEPFWPPPVRTLMRRYPAESAAELLPLLCKAAPELRFFLLPYRAVGVSGGLMPAFRCPEAELDGRRFRNLPVAVSPTELGGGCCALWGAERACQSPGSGNRRC